MAEGFFLSAASNAVGTLMVDYLVKPIERRIRYLFCFRSTVEELHRQQRKLTIEQSRLQEDVKEAKLQIQTQVIEDYVHKWLTDTENVLKDIQSLDCRVEENKRCFWLCPNWCWRYQLSKEIKKKTKCISKLVEESHFDRIGHRAELPALEFVASKDLVAAKSSTAAFNEIMEALKDDKINIIGVWGMGGVGKTTLVKEVGNKFREFGQPIMVAVSRNPDIGEMQNKIADDINLEFEKMTRDERAKELWSRLRDGTFLIILDDLWKEEDLRKIGIPLVEKGKGCKIILTTRRRTVCENMECQVIVQVHILDGDEAWALFKMKANLDERVSRDIVEEAKKVAEECKGLPVAIVTLARALKGTKTRKAWELARKKLQSSRLIEIGNIEEELDQENDANRKNNAYWCIKMSYEYLKKEPTKRCFLLCALYPEDHSIDVEDLVQFAWALELYDKVDSVEDVRTEVMLAIDYLKDSCLLLKDDVGRNVKLHDMVRDVALWIASEEDSSFMIKSRIQLLNKSHEPCKAISLLENVEENFPEKLVCPNLQILLLKNYDVQGMRFQGMQALKVLSLAVPRRSRRPICFYPFTLPNLRSLYLENFDLWFLGSLRMLEILRLVSSGSETLADEIGMLENLKILDLAKCGFSYRFPRNLIRRLPKLEELYLRDVKMEEESRDILLEINFLTKLKILYLGVSSLHLPEHIFELPRLERYEIVINGAVSFPSEKIRSFHWERSLKVMKACPLNLVSRLLENIESLEVSSLKDEYIECLCDKKQNKVSVPIILQNLKQVVIRGCRNLEVVFQMENVKENAAPLLSNLKHLYLRHLSKLSHIWELPTQYVKLDSLVHLKIWNCPRLKSVFSVPLAQSLALLENLEVSYCGELTQIITELECDGSIDSPNSLCFPKLTTLEIQNCNRLEYIFPTSMASQGLPQLEILSIHACPRLKQVVRPTENDTVLLQFSKRLMTFSVSACPSLTDSFAHFEVENASFKEFRLSTFKGSFSSSNHLRLSAIEDHNLIPDAKEDGLNEMTSLGLSYCKKLECLVDTTTTNGPTSAFTRLETLYTSGMDGFETLCRGEPPLGFLENLKELAVRQCNKFQELFQMEENQDQPFSNLQSLDLDDLPELRWIFGSSTHSFKLQSLKVVDIFRCNKLESLLPPSVIQSLVLLEEIKINNCDRLKTLFTEPENGVVTESSSSLPPMSLPNFRRLEIHGCGELEYVLPITLAQGLPALEIISVSRCDELKQVFGMVKEQNVVGQDNTVLLDVLWSLRFCSLTNLSCLVPGNYIFKAPVLENLFVDECPRLMNFAIDQVNKQLHLQTGGSFALVDMPHKHEDLPLDGWEVLGSLVHATQEVIGLCTGQTPQGFLQNPRNLIVESFRQLREVYKNDEFVHNREENQAPPLLSNSEYLSLISLPELRWILKSPVHPASFQRLLVLRISNCNKMESLFSLSSFQAIWSLQELHIVDCNVLKSVFMELESSDDDQIESTTLCLQNLKSVEITNCPSLEYVFPFALAAGLPGLETICLYNLQKVSSFFAAPALDVDGLPGCTDITIREESFPLKELQSSDDDHLKSNTLWLPNLKSVDISGCPGVEYVFRLPLARGLPCLLVVRLHDLGNLRGLVADNNFVEAPVLESLSVHGCPRVTNLTFQKEILKCVPIKELDFSVPEVIIDPESCNMASVPSGQRPPSFEYINLGNFEQLFQLQSGHSISNLEELKISNMIWLRHIWNGPIQFATNLRILVINSCHSLTHIFPAMLIRNLPKLNSLYIEKCEKLEQIIASDASLASSSSQGRPFEKIMEFPRLEVMQLQELPSLVSFSPLSYHMVFSILKSLRVENCRKMVTSFTMDHLTLTVHAKTYQAPPQHDGIFWERDVPYSLPQYMEEAGEILTLS